jgi:hypothetical protein
MDMDLPQSIVRERHEKAKITGGTKMEQERWRKINVGETMDKLDAIGNPNKKVGIRETKKAMDEYRLEQFLLKSDRINWLNRKAKFTRERQSDYYRHVKTLVDYELSFLDLPHGYSVKSEVTEKGIKLILKDRFGQIHLGAFTPSGIAVYDEQACRTSVNKIDDKISLLEENPPSGLYLP